MSDKSKTKAQLIEGLDALRSQIEKLAIREKEYLEKHKMAEASLRRSEEKYRNLSDNNLIGVYMIEDGALTYANMKFADIFGYSLDELVGGIGVMELVHPDDREIAAESISRRAAGDIDTINYQVRGVRKDGKVINIDVYGSISEEHGTRTIQGAVIDITESVGFQKALQASEERYKKLFLQNPLPMYIYNQDALRIIDSNEAMVAHYGYSRDEILGMTIMDLRPSEDVEKVVRDVAKVESGVSYRGIWRHVKKDGSIIDVEITSSDIGIRDDGNRVVLCNDVTERLRVEKHLKIQSDLLHVFAAQPDMQRMFDYSLEVVMKATGSDLGYIGYIDEKGDLVIPTLTGKVWEICEMKDKTNVFTRDMWTGLLGESLIRKETVLANHVLNPPEGHMPLSRAIGVAILYEDEIIGQISVANKATDYNEDDVRLLESISASLSSAMKYRLDQVRYEQDLKNRADELESFNSAMLGREGRIIELKEEVNSLCTQLGKEVSYPPVWREGESDMFPSEDLKQD